MKTNYRKGEPQLIQFVREKGKRVPVILPSGMIVRESNGKVAMQREKGLPRGILVAGMIDDKVCIGWSYTNNKLDRFDKSRGMDIAVGRMESPSPIEKVPHKVLRELEKSFLPRVEKYFGVSIGC